MEPKLPQLPFLTREMLSFGNQSKFELVLTTIAKQTFTVEVRGITRSGIISHKQITTSNSQSKTTTFQIDDIPVMIGITSPEEDVVQSELYAILSLKINGEIAFPFLSGWVCKTKGLSWPNSNLNNSVPNRGHFKEVRGELNAAGDEAMHEPQANELWKIHSVAVTLTTSATVANRRVHLNMGEESSGRIEVFGSIDQAASLTKNYWFMPIGAIPAEQHDDDIIIPIPQDFWLSESGLITTKTVGLQVGDQFGRIYVGAEIFFMGK